MRPKKILIFSLVYYPHYVGGAESAVKEITDRIDPEQVEFHIITLRRSVQDSLGDKIGNVTVHRIGWPFFSEDIVKSHFFITTVNKILYPITAFFTAIRLQKKYGFDATWSLMANYSGFAAYFFKLFNNKIPLILSLQEGDSEKHLKYRWFGLINLSWKLTLKKADFLVAISNYLLQRAQKIGFKGNAHLIPNGVNISLFSQEFSNEARGFLRNNIGLNDDDTVLITSSRLSLKNGVSDVIKALLHLPTKVKFVICGVGELESSLRNLSKRLGVEDRVFFLGQVPNEELYKYLKAADIFIRPSLSEGMGNSFIEAMASKIPIIATPVGGIVDFIFDPNFEDHANHSKEQTGFLCKPSDPKNIAEAVLRVMVSSDKDRVIERAFEMVKEKYDWDHVSADFSNKVVEKI